VSKSDAEGQFDRFLAEWSRRIFLTVLAANLFGNAVRDAFDPRLR
jgi:hypothetical protein